MAKTTYEHRQMTAERPAPTPVTRQPMMDLGVRVVRAWGTFVVGQVLFPVGLHRDRLIECGYVVTVKPAETANADEPSAAA